MLLGCGELAIGEAESRAAEQAQPYNPQLSLGLGARRQAGLVGVEAEVGIEQSLEIAGQRKLRRRAAHDLEALGELGLDAAAWAVHAEVHLAFESVLLARSELALADELVGYERELLAMAQRKVELGDESGVIVELAGAELALAENEAAIAQAALEAARVELALVSGWPDPATLEPLGELEAPATLGDHDSLVARALERSPVLARARKARELASSELELAEREARPDLTLGAQYQHEGSTSAANPASHVWLGVVQVSLPSFQRNQGARYRGRAALELAATRELALAQRFEASVGVAAIEVDAAAERVAALEQRVVPAFERTLAGLRLGYEAGEFDYLDVAQARERVWAARKQVFVARADYYEAFAALERLVGPLPSSDEPEPVAFERANACSD